MSEVNLEKIHRLLDEGADLDAADLSPAERTEAFEFQRLESLLQEAGSDFEMRGSLAASIMSQIESEDRVKDLTDYTAAPSFEDAMIIEEPALERGDSVSGRFSRGAASSEIREATRSNVEPAPTPAAMRYGWVAMAAVTLLGALGVYAIYGSSDSNVAMMESRMDVAELEADGEALARGAMDQFALKDRAERPAAPAPVEGKALEEPSRAKGQNSSANSTSAASEESEQGSVGGVEKEDVAQTRLAVADGLSEESDLDSSKPRKPSPKRARVSKRKKMVRPARRASKSALAEPEVKSESLAPAQAPVRDAERRPGSRVSLYHLRRAVSTSKFRVLQCVANAAVVARVTVSGKTGRVTAVQVDGKYQMHQKQCISRAITQTARFPEFVGGDETVVLRFSPL